MNSGTTFMPRLRPQRFHRGDLVKIDDDLGEGMSHFPAGVEAIVIGSHDDRFGGGNTRDYTLHIKDRGQCSWYHEHQLELIESARSDLLEQWSKERDNKLPGAVVDLLEARTKKPRTKHPRMRSSER
jgi:hypothetical protein